jgi:hypothetical protein
MTVGVYSVLIDTDPMTKDQLGSAIRSRNARVPYAAAGRWGGCTVP